MRWLVLSAGAAVLALAACLLYLPIANQFLQRSSDHKTHIASAEQLFRTQRLVQPHFLYQLLIAGLDKAAPMPFKTAGLLVLAVFYALTGAFLYLVTARVLLKGLTSKAGLLCGALAALPVAAAILVMQPVVRPGDPQVYRIGYFWAEPYYSLTFSVMKPLALMSAFSALAFLNAGAAAKTPSPLAIVAAALLTAAGTLAKPSFAICLIPAVLVLAALRSFGRQSLTWRALLLGVILPASAVLILQYVLSYSGAESGVRYQRSVIFAPLKVLRHHSEDLGVGSRNSGR
jgi:hypothetical protein